MNEPRGNLGPGVLGEVLREIFIAQETGALSIARGAEGASIQVDRGRLTHVETELPGARLGDLLIQVGFITTQDRDAALELAALRGERFGWTLVRTGLLDEEGVTQGLSLQLREVFARAMTWAGGVYNFVETPPGPERGVSRQRSVDSAVSGGDPAPGSVDPREALIEAAWTLIGDPALDAIIGDPQRRLRRAQDSRLEGLDLKLNPSDAFLATRIDGVATAEEILLLAPGGEDEARASLAGLLLAGVVEYEGAPAPISATTEIRRVAAARLLARVELSDPYEVLAVARTATTLDIRAAYLELLRVADPTSTSDPALHAAYRRMAARAFDAFRALEKGRLAPPSDARQPTRSIPRTGPGRAPRSPGTPASFGPASSGSRRPSGRIGRGRTRSIARPGARILSQTTVEPQRPAITPEEASDAAFRAAEAGNFVEALALLHEAIPRLTGRARRLARTRRARILMRTGGEKLAETELKEATAEDPGNAEAWFLLGAIFEMGGAVPLALSAYRKAAAIDPRDREAQDALARFDVAAAPGAALPGGEASRSVLGRLFRR